MFGQNKAHIFMLLNKTIDLPMRTACPGKPSFGSNERLDILRIQRAQIQLFGVEVMVETDILRMVGGMLALVPLSYPIRFIPQREVRKAYSLVLGLIIQLFVFQSYMYPIYLQHLIAYLLIRFRGPKCGAIVTFESMFFLSGYHIYQYLYNYGGWTMNASALLMILVCKYSLLAYALEDGSQPVEKLSKEQIKNRVTQPVGFLDFMGYINFLPTSLIGPPFEYNDYKNFMNREGLFQTIPTAPLRKLVLITFAETIFFASIYVLGDMYFPLSRLKSDQFYQNGPMYIFWWATISVYMLRCKYYFGWKLSMASIHSSGVSYSGGEEFKGINTVNPLVMETTMHMREKIANWNIAVQEWIRKCIYQRAPFRGKEINQLYAFVISAFWHGFYAAYYISYAFWYAQLYLQTLIYKYTSTHHQSKVVKFYEKTGKVGHWTLSMLATLLFSHLATYFLILDSRYNFALMRGIYYFPQISVFVLIIVFSVLTRRAKRVKHAPKENKASLESAKKE